MALENGPFPQYLRHFCCHTAVCRPRRGLHGPGHGNNTHTHSPRGAGVEGEDEGWDFGTGAGFYVDATLNGPGCTYRTTAHSFEYHDYSTGFRCCDEGL